MLIAAEESGKYRVRLVCYGERIYRELYFVSFGCVLEQIVRHLS